MIKRRDPIAINSVGEYLELSSEELNNLKITLDNHIKEIEGYYKGIDSQIVISKFLEASARMNTMIANFKYYSQYFKSLSNHDKENLEQATKQFQDILDEISNNDLLNKIGDININIDEVEHV